MCLLALGMIVSVLSGSLTLGFGIVGGFFVVGLIGVAVWMVVLIRRRNQGQ